MSRIVAIPYTHTSDVVSFDSTNSTYYAILTGFPTDNGLGDGTTGSYAGFNLTRGSNAITNIYYNFDCSAIPDDATITSVSCYYRASISTTTTNYVNTSNLQLCAGTTAKGTATSKLTTTATFYTINGGSNWTVAEIKNCKIRGYAKRGTRNTSSQYAIRLFGGTLTVEYTVQGIVYSITATSNVSDETISPSTQEVQEGGLGSVKIVTDDLTNKTLLDNNTNVTSSLVYIPPDTGGTMAQYPADVETGGSGTISGLRYLTTIGHGVENPSGTTSTDYTATGGTTALIYYKFDFNDLPDSATIDSMTVQVRYKVGSTSYAQSVNTYSGTTTKGTAVTLTSTSETTTTISSPGIWTAAQLKDDPRVGLTLSYSGAIITGITWSVTYTANEPAYYKYTLSNVQTDHDIVLVVAQGGTFYIKQNGTWNEVSKIYLKQNESWVEQDLDYLDNNNIKYLKQGS